MATRVDGTDVTVGVDAGVDELEAREQGARRGTLRGECDGLAGHLAQVGLTGHAGRDVAGVDGLAEGLAAVAEVDADLEGDGVECADLDDAVGRVLESGARHGGRVADAGVVGEPLAVVGGGAVPDGHDQWLDVAELVLGQCVAERPEGAEIGLAGTHGGDEAGVVRGDEALDLDAECGLEDVHERLDVILELLLFLTRDEAERDLSGPRAVAGSGAAAVAATCACKQ